MPQTFRMDDGNNTHDWTSQKVQQDMQRLLKQGAFGPPISWQNLRYSEIPPNPKPTPPNVRAVLWNSDEEPPIAPRTWEEWFTRGEDLIALANKASDKDFSPEWEMIPFRHEDDFYAGAFGDFVQLWLPIVKELQPPLRSRAYSVLSKGVDVFGNLKSIRFDEPVVFRGKTKIATKHIRHESNIPMFDHDFRLDYDTPKDCRKGDGVLTEEWPVFRSAKYPVHVGGKIHGKRLIIDNPRGILQHHPAVLETLLKWAKTGALRVIKKEEEQPLMTSAIILVPKGLGWRACYDGSPLTFLETRSVKCKLDGVKEVMSTIQKGDVLIKLDDKSAFHHLLLDPMSSRMAAMKWGGITFAYRAAAFGIPRIPSEYQLINGTPINYLRNRGHIILLYLDDRLIIIRPKSDQERQDLLNGKLIPRSAFAMCALATGLGTFIHREKSTFLPLQRLEYLGFIFDTEKETIAIPQPKWDKFQAEVQSILATDHLRVKALERIRGKCVHFMYVERRMRLYIREQNAEIKEAERKGFATIPINKRLRRELNRWLDPSLASRETKWIETGVCELHTDADHAERTLVYTDASGAAGGLYIDETKSCEPFYWTKKDAGKNIYMKEAIAILVALRRKGSLLANRRVMLKCDNQIVCSAIYNGSRASSDLNDVVLNIWEVARKHNIDIRTEYVNTKEQLADEPSRTFDFNECKVTDKAFAEIKREWGKSPTIDAFAASENTRCSSYISRYHDDEAWKVDFFTVTKWRPKEVIYAFPPTKLAPLVFKYLRKYAKNSPWALVALGYEIVPVVVALANNANLRVIKLQSQTSVVRPNKQLSEEWDYYRPVDSKATTFVIFSE
jgi:hypothetical protein